MIKGAQSLVIEPEAREAVARLSRVAWAGEAATGGKVHSDDESMYRLTATRTPSGLTERSELDESERDERSDGNWVRGERTSIQAKPGTKNATRDGPRVGPYTNTVIRTNTRSVSRCSCTCSL